MRLTIAIRVNEERWDAKTTTEAEISVESSDVALPVGHLVQSVLEKTVAEFKEKVAAKQAQEAAKE